MIEVRMYCPKCSKEANFLYGESFKCECGFDLVTREEAVLDKRLSIIEKKIELIAKNIPNRTFGDLRLDHSDEWLSLDNLQDIVRLINVWERVQKRIEFAFHPDLDGAVVELTSLQKDEIADFKMNWFKDNALWVTLIIWFLLTMYMAWTL